MTLSEAINDAALKVRMQMGKNRMVDKACQLSLEIADQFNLSDECEVEDMIWERVF